MKRRAKIAVSAAVFAASMLAAGARLLAGRRRQPTLTVLYYHAVPAAQLAGFRRQMQFLARRTRVVPADWRGAATDDPRPVVAITFDDAFDSVLDNALPVLAALRLHCTVFAPSGHLGAPPTWAMETGADAAERVAAAARLAKLPPALVTIGSHTVTHPRLTTLAAGDAMRELSQSRKDLAEVVGRPVDLLAFPYGDHDDAVVALCQQSGYRHVFTILPSPVAPAAGAFVRGRVAVDPTDGPFEFLLKMSGSYRWMPAASALKRRWRPARGAARTTGCIDA